MSGRHQMLRRDETSPQDQTLRRDETAGSDVTERERADAVAREHTATRDHTVTRDHNGARDRFGGINWGASFFGWLVAVALAVLLTSIVGAIATGVGSHADVSQTDAQRQAGTIGIAAAVTLLVVLAIGYYAGGYVAGRMSRFDGARQGLGVWALGLLVTIVALVLGAIFGSQYNVLDRVSLPNLPLSTSDIGWGVAVTALAVLVVTLLAAMLGGTVGRHYHDRVDREADREADREVLA
jgi:hypothetical protein